MADNPDDLGDARSRTENGRFRDLAERRQGSNPEYAYAPRWAPMGNWRMSAFDLLFIVFGLAVLVTIVGLGLFGAFD
ncbi:hypothetical protein [Roseococcus pinisoli]|uniref:Uncharacterized protein n=1 Tax=Roseococcus pinisoli TaxID=2835040 RepID=A0ABS5QBE7_9PROT|nr:hypothetical protein [Roseococcus pinisoli]MBS7810758.1 hypothetical protein [Roseococcus pinisoli]